MTIKMVMFIIIEKMLPSSGLAADMPAKDENISGAPLPRAIIVTPAIFWDNLQQNNFE